ncbi:MAG: hypothetical protein LBR80_19205 [Deltaproteobacteria bacterium]|jgi:hypothetical protein|nr:hypothetical protein [Deltaproteobacteria bacterium]
MRSFKFLLGLPLAAALILCGAGTSSAESPVTFDGHLRLRSWFFDKYFSQSADANGRHASRSDSWAESRLRLNVSFKPNESVEIRWRAQGPGSARWGSRRAEDRTLRSEYFYGIARTGIGDFSIGRVSSDIDSSGLQTLGWTPSYGMGTQFYIFDMDSDMDGAMYRWHTDNFGVKAFYVKRDTTPPQAFAPVRDADYDRFSVEPYWTWDTGGASIALQYDNDKTGRAADGRDSLKFVSVNPAFAQSFDVGEQSKLTFHAEAKFAWGKRSYAPGSAAALDPRTKSKVTGAGAYMDLNLDYGPGDATLAGWWFNGANRSEGDLANRIDTKDLVDPGTAFYPFLIFYKAYGDQPAGSMGLEGNGTPGHWALALMGKQRLNDWVSLTYGLGHFRKTGGYTLANGRSVSKTLGTEVNLGLAVKLLDNLTWSTNAAFFDSGSYYQDRYGNGRSGSGLDRTIWGWGNELMFSF